VECREYDPELDELLEQLHHRETDLCVRCERAMNARLGGGCQVPIAGYAVLDGHNLHMRGLVGEPDGGRMIHADFHGSEADPDELGSRVAEKLLSSGAERILEKYLEF
jgi:hydroxymethylbilane synthase